MIIINQFVINALIVKLPWIYIIIFCPVFSAKSQSNINPFPVCLYDFIIFISWIVK